MARVRARSWRRPGRPTKLDDERVETLLEWLTQGCTVRASCAAAKITRETYYDWLKTKPEFSDTVEAAMAQAERKWILLAEREKPGGAVKLLERRFRQDWGPELTLNSNQKVTYELKMELVEPDGQSNSDATPDATPEAVRDHSVSGQA